ncbi:MAG: hypothetical protein ACK5XN_13125, partial [Bacteroidota bacterium]
MRLLLTILMLASFVWNALGQDIPEFKLKETSYGLKKLDKMPKKIYISQFRINFQTIYLDKEFRNGGYEMGGTYRGDVSASLQLGLKGLLEKDLQDITDDIYKDCIERIKKQGYEIVTAEEVAGIDVYEGWERKKGGTLSKAQVQGYITATPSNYEYFVKGTKESGKEKSTFLDKSGKISKQLKGVGVLRININVPFARDGESQGSKMLTSLNKNAKVVAEANVHISNMPASSSPTEVTTTDTRIAFDAGTGLAEFMNAAWTLKDEIDLPGLVEKKKYKAVEAADRDWSASDAGLFSVFHVDDKFLKKTQQVDVDRTKYISTVGT